MLNIALLSVLLAAIAQQSLAFSFSLSSSSPAQCGVSYFTWSGGTAPYYLTVIPEFDYPSNVTIPDSAYSNGAGSYGWSVNYPSGTKIVFVMSDATGFAAGGISAEYSVSGSSNSSSCTLRSTSTDFLFYLNETSITQCEPLEIYWDSTAVAPVSIIGVIPGGQAFQLNGETSSDQIVWDVNVASGTKFILSAWDKGGNGGTSAIYTVGGSSDSSCLGSDSPSSTPVSTATATSNGGDTTSTRKSVVTVTAIKTSLPAGAAGLSTGAIVGIVIGVVIAVLALQVALVYFCCRRQLANFIANRRRQRERRTKAGDVDLLSAHGGSEIGSPRVSVTGQELENGVLLPSASALSLRSAGGRGSGGGARPLTTATSASQLLRHSFSDAPPDEAGAISPYIGGSEHPSSPLTVPWELNSDARGLFDGTVLSPDPSHSPTTLDTNASRNSWSLASGLALPATGASGMASGSRVPSKSQLAAANPDDATPGSSIFSDRQPPVTAPRGGFRRHEDAGPLSPLPQEDTVPGPEVEDLPPNYDPQWERR